MATKGSTAWWYPDRELVVVHLGKSPVDTREELTGRLRMIVNSVTSL